MPDAGRNEEKMGPRGIEPRLSTELSFLREFLIKLFPKKFVRVAS